jgi:hypothetical protein
MDPSLPALATIRAVFGSENRARKIRAQDSYCLTDEGRKLVKGHSGEYRSKIKTARVAGRGLNFEEILFAQKREAPEVTEGPSSRSAMPTFNYR